jgi:hypothetical protein
MRKKSVQVIVGKTIAKGAPGALGQAFEFKPGDSFHTTAWFYPGEPFEKGSIGDLMGHKQERWSFWTGWDIDFSLIFDAEDIQEVIIPNDPETIGIFEGAPFKVIIQESKAG